MVTATKTAAAKVDGTRLGTITLRRRLTGALKGDCIVDGVRYSRGLGHDATTEVQFN
jgi:hypothetical protein